MKERKKKTVDKRYYINIIRDTEVVTQMATQEEIDKLKASGEEVVVAEDNAADDTTSDTDDTTDSEYAM